MADISQYKDLNLVMAAMTDKLADKLERMGQELVNSMNESNRFPDTVEAYEAEDHINGVLAALTILGIPYKVLWQGERDTYTGVEIAGRMFYAGDSVREAEECRK